MKTYKLLCGFFSMALLAACNAPEVHEIKPNETAFLVTMTGNSKAQKMFMSEEYLNENKVASKIVIIPIVDVPCGAWGQKMPSAKLITVDRTPITREWTRSEKTGTSPSNQAISAESKESIDFTIGVVMTASIPEEQAAKFLYKYAGTPLSQIADTNIRGFVQGSLAREFGIRSLDQCRAEKAAIFAKVFAEAKVEFLPKGINIDNLGYSEGMTYNDANIQKSINENFQAEMAVHIAEQKVNEAKQLRIAAEEFAKAKDATVARVDLDVKLIQANAQKDAVAKWDGHLPNGILPQGSSLLFGLDRTMAK